MAKFTQEQCNFALLFLYVGEKGPRALKKYVIDKLFTYQLLKNENYLRDTLSSNKISLIFPNDEPVSSLDKLDDAEVLDVSALVFNHTQDIEDIKRLRRQIYAQLEGPIFCEFMNVRKDQFRKKNKRNKLLSRHQMDTLFPSSGSININKLDITLLSFILFEGFNYLKPVADLDKFPDDSDISPGSDILRIKLCRNSMAHNTDTEISEEDFCRLWECMTLAFERLTGDATYRQEGDRLKCERPQINTMNQLRAILEKWRKDDRDERSEHLNHLTKVMMSEIKRLMKRRKPSRKWVALYRDFKKFKAVCKRNGIKYKIQVESSTESNVSSSCTMSSASSISSLVPFSCDIDHRTLLPQITVHSASRQRRGYVFNERDEKEFLRFMAESHLDEGTDIYCYGDMELAHGKLANSIHLHEVGDVEYRQDNDRCTLESQQRFGITEGEEYYLDLLPQNECDEPVGACSAWSLSNINMYQHVQAGCLETSSYNEDNDDQWTLQPQITVQSASRQRRGYVFNERDTEEFLHVMPELRYDEETDVDCCQNSELHYQEMVPYTGMSVYNGPNSESSGYYTSALSEFAASSSAYGITERNADYRDRVPYTGTSFYSGANSESTGYYTSELATSSSAYANIEEEAADNDLYSYVDNAQLSRIKEDGCYAAELADNPGSGVYSDKYDLVPLDREEQMQEKTLSSLHAMHVQRSQEDTVTLMSTNTASTMDIKQGKSRHRRRSKSRFKRICSRLFGGGLLKCITFKEPDIPEPMMNISVLAERETSPLQNPYERRNSRSNNETSQDAELLLEEPYAETNIL